MKCYNHEQWASLEVRERYEIGSMVAKFRKMRGE